MQQFIAILLITYIFCPIINIYGQACCSGGVPVTSNLGLSGNQAGSLQFLLTYDYNVLKDLMDGRTRLNDDNSIL